MTHFIKLGGLGVIAVVFGIFIFILWQVLPLLQNATVGTETSKALPDGSYQLIGIDEYSELPFAVNQNGAVTFVDLLGQRPHKTVEPGFVPSKNLTSVTYRQNHQHLIYGTEDGQFGIVDIEYKLEFQDETRRVNGALQAGDWYPASEENAPIRKIAYGDGGERKLVAVFQESEGRLEVRAATLSQQQTLFGAGDITVDQFFHLTPQIEGVPRHLLVNENASAVYVGTREGVVYYFRLTSDGLELEQSLKPFEDLNDPGIAKMEFLLGDVTLVFVHPSGANRLFSLYLHEVENQRLLGQTKEFPALPSAGNYFYAHSLRNKAFLVGHGPFVSLRYGTTETTRWEKKLEYKVEHARLSGKYDRILLLDADRNLHLLQLDDPHPEAGLKAFFGKVWYEGASEPSYSWQSTGGSDQFEPKLSLVPLIIGTLKGTLYAMIFSCPVALLAAIYTSQFAAPRLRHIVKPTMEIMASLPSVVLGFLAALWLAPIIDTRIPSLLLIFIGIPISAMALGGFWSSLPIRYRHWIPPGYEFIAFVPILIGIAWLGWSAGPWLEQQLFVVTDPQTATRTADFRLWWPEVTGADFQQRNSLVVGFAMGFAVIPIIFTITEDSLSNVPGTLRSGALALGASRWQTTLRVVLPTAFAGIFSALMIGLGRAVGETMIVVMATGNTPIMDWNIFSGMRTLSANIAVELPEAPHHSTLYRTLFLGGMVLFLMTFLINTLAEMLRQHLREKFKTV